LCSLYLAAAERVVVATAETTVVAALAQLALPNHAFDPFDDGIVVAGGTLHGIDVDGHECAVVEESEPRKPIGREGFRLHV